MRVPHYDGSPILSVSPGPSPEPQASVSCLLSLTRHDPCSDQSVKSGAFGVLNTILNTKALYAVASLRTDVCRLVGHLILRSSDKNARIAADSGLIKTIAMMLDGASSDGQEGALSMLRELAPEPSVRVRARAPPALQRMLRDPRGRHCAKLHAQ